MTGSGRRSLIIWAIAIAGGIGLGLVSAVIALAVVPKLSMVERDGWTGHPAAGSAQASPYARAIIARIGLLAMSRDEAVYLDRTRDDDGQPLRGECRYRIAGRALPAQWWSVTLYAEDNYLAQNGEGAPSIDATSVLSDQPIWSAEVGPQRPATNTSWIASKGAEQFTLTLRLYRPTTDVFAKTAAVDLPTITRIDCPTNQAPSR